MEVTRSEDETDPKQSLNSCGLTEKHCFSLIFASPGELTDELENEIFEAGCGDALLGIQGGELFPDFRREAPSFQVALLSAILAVEPTGLPLELIRVDCS